MSLPLLTAATVTASWKGGSIFSFSPSNASPIDSMDYLAVTSLTVVDESQSNPATYVPYFAGNTLGLAIFGYEFESQGATMHGVNPCCTWTATSGASPYGLIYNPALIKCNRRSKVTSLSFVLYDGTGTPITLSANQRATAVISFYRTKGSA
jgi:hypothetical protein